MSKNYALNNVEMGNFQKTFSDMDITKKKHKCKKCGEVDCACDVIEVVNRVMDKTYTISFSED